MKQSGLFIIASFLTIFLLMSCNPPDSEQTSGLNGDENSQASLIVLPTASFTPSFTNTPFPPTDTPTVTPTETITPTPTVVPAVTSWISFYVEYQQYSQIILEFNAQAGLYYGTGIAKDGSEIAYQCVWFALPSTQLSCKGSSIPVNTSVKFSLYSLETGEKIYNNTFTYQGLVPTPTGMSCEVEPQWGGQIEAHQKDMGCFALSCYQNGAYFYGNNNTCETPWPFAWDFYHPLHPPRQ